MSGWSSPRVAVRDDYRTACTDLGATHEQALLVAAHALARRVAAVLLPCATAAALVLISTGVGPAAAALPLAAIVGPSLVASLLTFPVAFVAAAQALFGGTQETRRRFGISYNVYVYYGWRYAFRRRQRPWGALSVEEKRLADPRRAAAYRPTAPEV